MNLYGVYGASGFGREVLPLVRQQVGSKTGVEIVFIDDQPADKIVNGHRVLTYPEFLAIKSSSKHAVIAIANSQVREKLAKKCSGDGVEAFSVSAANSVVLDGNVIGEGAILCSFVNVTSNARIGKYFHANIYSYVAHDCVIGDYVTFAPGVKCNGNVVIEDHAYVGTGAILKQGKPGAPLVIGKGAVVGMGAVVTKSVAPGTTVIGNPARPMVK